MEVGDSEGSMWPALHPNITEGKHNNQPLFRWLQRRQVLDYFRDGHPSRFHAAGLVHDVHPVGGGLLRVTWIILCSQVELQAEQGCSTKHKQQRLLFLTQCHVVCVGEKGPVEGARALSPKSAQAGKQSSRNSNPPPFPPWCHGVSEPGKGKNVLCLVFQELLPPAR